MRKVTLFIAMSLDGYVADKNGNVDWLEGQAPGEDDMVSYEEFIKNVDTVLMGWNTYHQIRTELSPAEWMYDDLTSYVITHRKLESTKIIRFVNEEPYTLVKRLRQEPGKGIWICGGPEIITPLIRENLIDRFHISIIPTILGNGIRLFQPTDTVSKLYLVNTENYNGIVDVVYERR